MFEQQVRPHLQQTFEIPQVLAHEISCVWQGWDTTGKGGSIKAGAGTGQSGHWSAVKSSKPQREPSWPPLSSPLQWTRGNAVAVATMSCSPERISSYRRHFEDSGSSSYQVRVSSPSPIRRDAHFASTGYSRTAGSRTMRVESVGRRPVSATRRAGMVGAG